MLEQDFGPSADPELAKLTAEQGEPGWWCCRTCQHRIARSDAGISFDGSHQHRFANPHGFEFAVYLFSEAPGLRPRGQPTDHFSWFVGYT